MRLQLHLVRLRTKHDRVRHLKLPARHRAHRVDGLARACLRSERRRPRLGELVRPAVRPSVRVRRFNTEPSLPDEGDTGCR